MRRSTEVKNLQMTQRCGAFSCACSLLPRLAIRAPHRSGGNRFEICLLIFGMSLTTCMDRYYPKPWTRRSATDVITNGSKLSATTLTARSWRSICP